MDDESKQLYFDWFCTDVKVEVPKLEWGNCVFKSLQMWFKNKCKGSLVLFWYGIPYGKGKEDERGFLHLVFANHENVGNEVYSFALPQGEFERRRILWPKLLTIFSLFFYKGSSETMKWDDAFDYFGDGAKSYFAFFNNPHPY